MDNIVKKLYNQLVTNVSATDTKIPSFSRPITETQYDSNKHGFGKKKIEDVGKKIPSTSGPVKKAGYNTKITEMENKISSVTGLVTTTMLNTKTTGIVNRIPDITIVATKAALNLKATEIDSKIRDITNLATKAV